MKVFEKKNIYSAWLAVDDNGTEKIFFCSTEKKSKTSRMVGRKSTSLKGFNQETHRT